MIALFSQLSERASGWSMTISSPPTGPAWILILPLMEFDWQDD